jgi:hypothetical protein
MRSWGRMTQIRNMYLKVPDMCIDIITSYIFVVLLLHRQMAFTTHKRTDTWEVYLWSVRFSLCPPVPVTWAVVRLNCEYGWASYPECRKKASLGFVSWKCWNWDRGFGTIITSYFAGKSKVSLITVIFENSEVVSCGIQPVQGSETNVISWERELYWLMYSIGHKSTYDSSSVVFS